MIQIYHATVYRLLTDAKIYLVTAIINAGQVFAINDRECAPRSDLMIRIMNTLALLLDARLIILQAIL